MAPSLRNRKPSKPETGSDTDAGDDALDEQYAPSAPPAATQAHSKGEGKLQKVVKRLVFGTLLLLTLCVIVASGHLATLGLVQVIQLMMFRELVNVRYSARKFADVPLFRTMQWGFFYTCMLYSYGNEVNTNASLYSLLTASPVVASLLTYVEIVCMGLYSGLLVMTVLSLTKGYYKYQMGQLAWTMAICLITVGQVTCFMANIFNGLFWFLFPVALVICNDSCAYFCGMGFGRKFTKRTFLALSPNKTWEGFVGGGVCTIIFAFFFPVALVHMKFLICPAEHMEHTIFGMDCKAPLVFTPAPYALPRPISAVLGIGQLTLLPVQLHALVLGLFASVVAPFGGFFASGIKRAYGLNDFAALIPGHGGVFDRVDCQLIMGLAMHVYHRTFIGTGAISLARVMTLAWQLSTEEQLDMYNQLGASLKQHGHL